MPHKNIFLEDTISLKRNKVAASLRAFVLRYRTLSAIENFSVSKQKIMFGNWGNAVHKMDNLRQWLREAVAQGQSTIS